MFFFVNFNRREKVIFEGGTKLKRIVFIIFNVFVQCTPLIREEYTIIVNLFTIIITLNIIRLKLNSF